jgi:tRNA1(Val) A37 N6-methylase TrmN6
LKTRNGARGVTNFKPVIAKYIYNTYVPSNGKVLDPCSGYSSRLLGCIAANKNILYHGIDPDSNTSVGNMSCASFFNNQYNIMDKVYKFRYRSDLGCAEEIMPTIVDNDYDIVFTSPPYFNLERYSDDRSQSHNKFAEYQNWLKGFLFPIVDNSHRILKNDGKLILNIKNIPKYNIADDLLEYCKKDWVLAKTYRMRLSNNEFNRKAGSEMFHTEPVFVWNKR